LQSINYDGIQTNNLKNIDVSISKNKITVLCGPNGSGKTSLAYHTIEKISNYEYSKIVGDNLSNGDFEIKNYSNIIPTISLKQLNHNNNPKSTIATYTGIDKYFKELFSLYFNLDFSIFSFNKASSSCQKCHGLGYELQPDINLIVDMNKSIEEHPFKNWNAYASNHYYPLLELFCHDNNIKTDIPIDKLSKKEQTLIFYSVSDKSYSVKFKQKRSYKIKKFSYIGVIKEIENFVISTASSNNIKAKSYVKQTVCSLCQGNRFSKKINRYKINNLSIGEMYNLDLVDLYDFFKKIKLDNKFKKIINNILSGIKVFNDSQLEYLNLNRSIPTLSGGELQRLRLSTILQSKISNILYILDEPSSSIYYKEIDALWNQIESLKDKNNTILLIEHNKNFIDKSNIKICLGPKAGKYGGEIVSCDSLNFNEKFNRVKIKSKNIVKFDNLFFNNIKNLTVKYPINTLIGISGPSGSGKSSFAKALHQNISNSLYISQKPLSSNINSIVATYIDILNQIKNEYAKNNNISKEYISFTNTEGACTICEGKGHIYTSIPFGDKIKNICPQCNGNRYNQKALEYLLNNLNILEVLKLSVSELIEKDIFTSRKIKEKLKFMEQLGLGYLNLFQETFSLSGGEAQRLKLVKNLSFSKNDKTYLIDEPFCGVDTSNIIKTFELFDEIIKKGSTIFIIEHNLFALSNCDYNIHIGPGKGKKGGKIFYDKI